MNRDQIKQLADMIQAMARGEFEEPGGENELTVIARAFLAAHQPLSNDWRNSTSCYEQLFDWFDQSESMTVEFSNEDDSQVGDDEEPAQKITVPLSINAIHGWTLQLESGLSSINEFDTLLPLCKAYFSDPNKYIAFLYFLIEKDVPINAFLKSQILHHYFAYQIAFPFVVEKTYKTLATLSEKASHFVEALSKSSCEMRGFVNLSLGNNQFQSYNLAGTFFSHEGKREEDYQEKKQKKLLPLFQITSNAQRLFYLFDWDFLKLLNTNGREYLRSSQVIISNLLDINGLQSKLLEMFPQKALQGEVSADFARFFLQSVGTLSLQTQADLIDREPFYLHLLTHLPSVMPRPEINFPAVVTRLCTDEKYKTTAHVPHLVSLVIRRILNRPGINRILGLVFEIVLSQGSPISDALDEDIFPIYDQLRPIALDRMGEYDRNIQESVAQLVMGELNFEEVNFSWGSQLSYVNLLKSLYPDFSTDRLSAYPFSIYELKTLVIKQYYEQSQLKEKPFSLGQIIDLIAKTPEEMTRILQEVLVGGKWDAIFIRAIFEFVKTKMSVTDFILKKFGVCQSVMYYAEVSQHMALLDVIREYDSVGERHHLSCITIAIDKGNVLFLNRFLQRIALTPAIIQEASRCLVNSDTRFNFSNVVAMLLHHALQLAEFDKQTILTLFYYAIDHRRQSVVAEICNLNSPNFPAQEAVDLGTKRALDNKNWPTLGLFCGLRCYDSTALVEPHNVRRYIDLVLGAYGENPQIRQHCRDAFQLVNVRGECLLEVVVRHGTLADITYCYDRLARFLTDAELYEWIGYCLDVYHYQDEIFRFLSQKQDSLSKIPFPTFDLFFGSQRGELSPEELLALSSNLLADPFVDGVMAAARQANDAEPEIALTQGDRSTQRLSRSRGQAGLLAENNRRRFRSGHDDDDDDTQVLEADILYPPPPNSPM